MLRSRHVTDCGAEMTARTPSMTLVQKSEHNCVSLSTHRPCNSASMRHSKDRLRALKLAHSRHDAMATLCRDHMHLHQHHSSMRSHQHNKRSTVPMCSNSKAVLRVPAWRSNSSLLAHSSQDTMLTLCRDHLHRSEEH